LVAHYVRTNSAIVSSTFLKVALAAQAKKRPFSFCKAFSFGATYSKEKALKEF
jgi:hypothetical protein